MSKWNYVVTAHKPTSVSHSCVGNFTGPHQLNLIVAYARHSPSLRSVSPSLGFSSSPCGSAALPSRKCTRIEIHLLTPQGLQPMLDAPIYGRIATIELFRPHNETQDFLFIATERYKFCVLKSMGDVSDPLGCPTDNGQVIPFDNKGQLTDAFDIRLEELQVLDIKFLYGRVKPTIVVLYQDNKDARHVKTYEVALKDKDFVEGPWSQNNLENGAGLLIPVLAPLGGVIIIGEETIVYCNGNSTFKAMPIKQSIIRAYGRVDPDGSRYLLGDNTGTLHLLVLAREGERVTGLKIEHLGETSIASSISYLDNGVVYVGSRFGDSQLVKLNLLPDATGSFVEVLERYVNLGPIVDFCVVDLDRQGQGQVVTCSGAFKDGSIRVVRNGIGINEQVLLATGGGHVVYLEIRNAKLVEVKHAQLDHEVSCVDLNPVGENPQYSSLAAIGLWTDISVSIYSLPDLELIRKENLGGAIVPRLAIAKQSEFSIGTIGDIQNQQLRTIPLNEQPKRICHQEQSRTLAVCSFMYNQDNDNKFYYCVGTSYVLPEEYEPAKHEESAIEELARDYNPKWMTAVEMIDDYIYVGAENSYNLFTVRKNSDAATDEETGRLEVVGEYHLGEFVSRFCHGSLVMHLPDSEMGQIPMVIFSTTNGAIGIIASLPHDHYVFLEKLQATLVNFIKGVGGLSHEQWRSFHNGKKTLEARNFLDGDLIESFLDLNRVKMEEVAEAMAVPVEELFKRVEDLTRLH
ncbi:hypothetical protein ACQ4PT_029885 [Festuca glaucescens]